MPDYSKMSEREFAWRMKWELFQNRFKSLCRNIFKKYINAFVAGVCLSAALTCGLNHSYGWMTLNIVGFIAQLFFIVHKELYGH